MNTITIRSIEASYWRVLLRKLGYTIKGAQSIKDFKDNPYVIYAFEGEMTDGSKKKLTKGI